MGGLDSLNASKRTYSTIAVSLGFYGKGNIYLIPNFQFKMIVIPTVSLSLSYLRILHFKMSVYGGNQ